MDPKQTYQEMLHSMQQGDQETARELALALKAWFNLGGFYPYQYSPQAMQAAIASVLRQTIGLTVKDAVFSLTCQHCDAGIEIGSRAEADSAGWTDLEYVPSLPMANYIGTCPDCQEEDG